MIKLVLDTNIMVSAFLTPAGKPAVILEAVLHRRADIFVNTAILAEYEEVLSRPKFAGKIHAAQIQRFMDVLRGIGHHVFSLPCTIPFTDESDRKFYDLALAAGAYLITGNARHFPAEPFIKTPEQFLSILSP